jgi:hypothetical protein
VKDKKNNMQKECILKVLEVNYLCKYVFTIFLKKVLNENIQLFSFNTRYSI